MRQNNTDLKDVWETPREILDLIDEEIDLDPCASKITKIGRENWVENGLDRSWDGYKTIFINPPFSQKEKWLAKAVDHSLRNKSGVIYFITPDSTDTKSWWHKYIAEYADYIWFSRGRINYISPVGMDPNPKDRVKTSNVTFGTAISIFGRPPDKTLFNLYQKGQLVKSIRY